jgi:hypothetical protein
MGPADIARRLGVARSSIYRIIGKRAEAKGANGAAEGGR